MPRSPSPGVLGIAGQRSDGAHQQASDDDVPVSGEPDGDGERHESAADRDEPVQSMAELSRHEGQKDGGEGEIEPETPGSATRPPISVPTVTPPTNATKIAAALPRKIAASGGRERDTATANDSSLTTCAISASRRRENAPKDGASVAAIR